MDTRLFGLVLLVLLVSFMQAEAAICETRSQQFKGLCFRNDNCGSICEKEGYLSGRCKGLLLRCFCEKDCGAGTPIGGGGGGGGPDGPPDGPPEGDGGPPDGPSGDPMTSNISNVEMKKE
ncbi:hypothetical protein Pfo_022965 [Paulownia fortunei]|nr:hypothetical protein Pfo_022965 [Paulownia fortunei]